METLTENMTQFDEQEQIRQKLLWNVKREVKQMMEEAVMKKCIHEENCSITTLCAAVEACLLHGLKRRAVGLFKTNTTMGLLQKISKSCPSAGEVMKIIDEQNQRNEDTTPIIFSLPRKLSIITQSANVNLDEVRLRSARSALHARYLWIRTALVNRSLHKIVEFIVENSSNYYEAFALLSNNVDGPIFASLLAGPCALEFTRVKTSDHLWTDPHADELVQRHRMHSNTRALNNPNSMMINLNSFYPTKFRPSLQINLKRSGGSSIEETNKSNQIFSVNPARDYVESLHQNAKSQLIYGKNNVLVHTVPGYDPIPGYLSLHHYQNGLFLKWTPNQLMNGYNENTKTPKNSDSEKIVPIESPRKISVYWEYAISINMSSIVYLHCHQHFDGDRIVFIGRDGVQYPPFHIKDKGGHLLAFLTCLESGLAPYGLLDPPLWYEQEQGKTFPKLYRRTDNLTSNTSSIGSTEEETALQTQGEKADEEISSPTEDYVFRIVFLADQDIIGANSNNGWQWPLNSVHSSSLSSQSSLSPPPLQTQENKKNSIVSTDDSSGQVFENDVTITAAIQKSPSIRTSMAFLCDTMRRQILSRAFFGWLTYCRHLKTVRIHLSSLVNPHSKIAIVESMNVEISLTKDLWNDLFISKQHENLSVDKKEIYRHIYKGGCDPSIRRQVWPFLFSHYSFDSTIDERKEIDKNLVERYEKLLNDWKSAETIVTQIDQKNANNRKNSMRRLFSNGPEPTSISAESALAALRTALSNLPEKFSLPNDSNSERKDSIVSNEVFFDDAAVHTVTIPLTGESSLATTPSGEHPFLSTSSNQSVLVARTRTQSIIDRSSPYNVIDTSNEDEETDEQNFFKPIDDFSIDETEQKNISHSSSLTSATDVFMDAVEILNEQTDFENCSTPIGYGSFSKEIIETFATNLHRIDKDVARCDRTYVYFTNVNNLKKLRNIMCTYVWDNLTTGYIQGMCDLVAPLLVVFDEEVLTYSCFCYLMKRLLPNFPHGAGMDEHFSNMRSLLQILDVELYEHIHRTGDFTHFYFCYRWFLLDFKREFLYDDIFLVWETIAAARRTVSKRFVLFIALAMLKSYREIILDNRMDFTDIIRFFNEMAERHDTKEILRVSRELVMELQTLIDNK